MLLLVFSSLFLAISGLFGKVFCKVDKDVFTGQSLSTGEVNGVVRIVDSSGARVKLACVNWYGAHMEGYVVNGLDRQTIASIAQTIKDMGFNCIRLPFSLEQYYENPYVDVRKELKYL